jgi:2-hydroxychromene-2-carboxylate isomerase
MDKNAKTFLIVTVLVLLIAGGLIFAASKVEPKVVDNTTKTEDLAKTAGEVAGVSTQEEAKSSDYTEKLAKFLAEKGMTMYGAEWCTHCQDQKKLFGDAFKYVDYVECDAKGPDANPDECVARDVKGYPTWIYEGKQYEGQKTLSELAEIVGFSQ